MKRGYLWLDWVELGCRGWDLEPEGAALDSDDQERCPLGHLDCYAHLDRRSLQLMLHGCRAFQVRVLNDLLAAGLFRFRSDEPEYSVWSYKDDTQTGFTAGTLTAKVSTVRVLP